MVTMDAGGGGPSGGEMRALHDDQKINDEVMILAFGEKGRSMLERYAHR